MNGASELPSKTALDIFLGAGFQKIFSLVLIGSDSYEVEVKIMSNNLLGGADNQDRDAGRKTERINPIHIHELLLPAGATCPKWKE